MIIEQSGCYAIAEVERAGNLIYLVIRAENGPSYVESQSLAAFGFPDKETWVPPASLSIALARQFVAMLKRSIE